CQQCNSDPLTF
nr:immunoglobulin light chain junction region [Macaca mulatta]MOX08429.1 immunoglobulin light chain junction region [Macaca mulatta]MOX08446.1 immunoglobulin light chain junction region [Macaca mulatta]MOX08867.1 immunoglobulin light chain junction region [Macaca mulatta]MOX10010.1 immunoglobulin light chain junction region [Macaca mulatta]